MHKIFLFLGILPLVFIQSQGISANPKKPLLCTSQEIEQALASCQRDKNAEACSTLGDLYLYASLPNHKPQRQTAAYQALCEKNSQNAFEKGCQLGHAKSCIQAHLTERGCFELKDPASCIRLLETKPDLKELAYQQACASGFGDACGMLGFNLQGQKRFPEAISWLVKGCDGKDLKRNGVLACLLLGRAHAKGQGTPKNPVAAQTALELACQKLPSPYQSKIYLPYPKDLDNHNGYLDQEQACTELGYLLYAQNHQKEAITLWKKANEISHYYISYSPHEQAEYGLGEHIRTQLPNTIENRFQAAVHFKKSCPELKENDFEKKWPPRNPKTPTFICGCYRLGNMFEQGQFVISDLRKDQMSTIVSGFTNKTDAELSNLLKGLKNWAQTEHKKYYTTPIEQMCKL